MFSFIDENGSKFYEINEGEIRCGGCTQSFSRIVRHLNQSPYCARNLNLDSFKSEWTKYTKRRKNERYVQKKKKENETNFLYEQAKRKKQSDEKQKAKDNEAFLNEQASRRKKCDIKQKAEDNKAFLNEQASRRKKCDVK